MHDRAPQIREMTGLSTGASWTDALRRRLVGPLILAVAAGFLMSATGAFGTGAAPVLQRTVYWVAEMVLGTLIAISARPLIQRTGLFHQWMWAEAAVVILVITTVGAPTIWLITTLTFAETLRGADIEFFIAPVAILSTAMTVLNYALQREPPITHAAPATAAPPRFLDRLPGHLRGAEVLAVEAEDHYLRIHTDRGQTMILMRLADAVAELEGIEGAQTHRSWWVARTAVIDAQRGEGRATLTLAGGLSAPVSRTYARALRDAGWFNGAKA